LPPDEDVPTALPLAGIRVADFSRVLAGPLATMLLGDLGADVVKVERPGTGDDTRGVGAAVRRRRRRLLPVPEPQQAFGRARPGDRGRPTAARRLALASDVVVENFRPG
jgi:Predicted acyl-CoA transferases/carnitine dehydratase